MKTALHFLRHRLGFDEAATQVTPAECECLRRYARGKRRVVEIGVFEGATTRLLAEAASPSGEVLGIDPFLGGRFGIPWGELIARKEVSRARGAKVGLVKGLSWDAARFIAGDFDLIFFDGDHSLEAIERDWTDWSDRVCKGGVVALHDSEKGDHNPEVRNYGSYRFYQDVISNDARYSLLEQVDSLSVLIRR